MLEKSISFYTLIDWVREIALLLFPRYQLFFEAIPRKIVDVTTGSKLGIISPPG
jgi:hypothetical protein